VGEGEEEVRREEGGGRREEGGGRREDWCYSNSVLSCLGTKEVLRFPVNGNGAVGVPHVSSSNWMPRLAKRKPRHCNETGRFDAS